MEEDAHVADPSQPLGSAKRILAGAIAIPSRVRTARCRCISRLILAKVSAGRVKCRNNQSRSRPHVQSCSPSESNVTLECPSDPAGDRGRDSRACLRQPCLFRRNRLLCGFTLTHAYTRHCCQRIPLPGCKQLINGRTEAVPLLRFVLSTFNLHDGAMD